MSIKSIVKLRLIGTQTAFTGFFTVLIKNRRVAKKERKENLLL